MPGQTSTGIQGLQLGTLGTCFSVWISLNFSQLTNHLKTLSIRNLQNRFFDWKPSTGLLQGLQTSQVRLAMLVDGFVANALVSTIGSSFNHNAFERFKSLALKDFPKGMNSWLSFGWPLNSQIAEKFAVETLHPRVSSSFLNLGDCDHPESGFLIEHLEDDRKHSGRY